MNEKSLRRRQKKAEEGSESNGDTKSIWKFMAKPDECLTPSVCSKPMMSLMSFGILNRECILGGNRWSVRAINLCTYLSEYLKTLSE